MTLKKAIFPRLAEKRRVRESTATGSGKGSSGDIGTGSGGAQGCAGVEFLADLAGLEVIAGTSTPDQRGRGGIRRSSWLARARSREEV